MGKCKYCQQNAGFFSNKHKECEQKFFNGRTQLIEIIESSIVNNKDLTELKSDILKVANNSFINEPDLNGVYTTSFDRTIEKYLEDGMLSKEEEARINEFLSVIFVDDLEGKTQEILNKTGSIEKVVKASILRDLAEGIVSEPRILVDQLPFIFQKTEKLIWVFNNAEYYEQVTVTHFEGGSHGVSFKVAKGIYYRTSSFRGQPVKTEQMKYLGNGILAITNKHLYFSNSQKTFKIPFNKIIALQPYEDGIGINKDGVSTKTQVFKKLDGWFVYNAISNLM